MLKDMVEKFPPIEDFGPRKVIRERKAEFLPDTAGLANLVATGEKHRELLERIGFKSYICVPMLGRDNVLGIISMAITDSGRHFSEADLDLAEVLAARATMAIENARLYREAREECGGARPSSRNSGTSCAIRFRPSPTRSRSRSRTGRQRACGPSARHPDAPNLAIVAAGR